MTKQMWNKSFTWRDGQLKVQNRMPLSKRRCLDDAERSLEMLFSAKIVLYFQQKSPTGDNSTFKTQCNKYWFIKKRKVLFYIRSLFV